MKCHQVLTGACNTGDKTFAVGRVEGIPFTAYAAGCNVVVLAQNFERVQVIPGVCHDNVQITCIDCSSDTGKIAATYGKLVCIFEPSPVLGCTTSHKLEYQWVQTGVIEASCCINNIAWNLEGTKLITAGETLQIWMSKTPENTKQENGTVTFDLGAFTDDANDSGEDHPDLGIWECVWEMVTSQPVSLLSFSPDGCLFATCATNDRLIKLWYDNSHLLSNPLSSSEPPSSNRPPVSYSYIYLPHPAAVTSFSWRTTSKYMPKGSVCNMLVSSCRDNICRVWVETVLPDDGLLAMNQLDPAAAQNPRFRTHRHKHKLMSRLKHIRTCFVNRRAGGKPTEMKVESYNGPVPTMPTSYSVHDFPSYGFHAMGVTPGFHFHLAASINAATDIPLVPSLAPGGASGRTDDSEHNFVLHWLNNKEMYFTTEAENILLEVSKKALEKELPNSNESERHSLASDAHGGKHSHFAKGGKSFDEDDNSGTRHHIPSHANILSAATSSTSIATDVTTATTSSLGDALDRKIETLVKSWLMSSDMLFSVHPVDGSLLVWILDFLDDYPGSFRQTQVSFCARIPNALPLGDAMTMSPHLALYTNASISFIKQLIKMELLHEEEYRYIKAGMKTARRGAPPPSHLSDEDLWNESSTAPVVCMTTKHANGSLNLWHITVEEGTKFTQVLNILHQRRVCGHRFQLNSVKCHPELPLLLTTSHHNKQQTTSSTPAQGAPGSVPPDHTPLICIQDPSYKDWCSELLIWKVDSVGPLNKSGGMTEIARLNSPQSSAFSTAAWIPTLLPSYTLGSVCNSPSACFVASDGERLRVYQAVLDGRALLAEMSMAERRTRRIIDDSTLSLSTEDSSIRDQHGQINLSEVFTIVSEQSTARPGCVLQLASIDEELYHSKSVQLLHVYQESLVKGRDSSEGNTSASDEGDVSNSSEDPFYVTLLEETSTGSVVHMWRLVMTCQKIGEEPSQNNEDEVFNVNDEEQPQTHRNHEASSLSIKSTKVCCQPLPLPNGITVVEATPSAGHLSSACIYPACLSPYLMVTACNDNKLRFWHCIVTGTDSNVSVEWVEWSMVSESRVSSLSVPGVPLSVSCAYSGRIACAYLPMDKASVVSPWPDASTASKFYCKVAVYECESTGGSQWNMCDPVTVEDVVQTDVNVLGSQLVDQAHVNKMTHARSTTNQLATAMSHEHLGQDSGDGSKTQTIDSGTGAFKSVSTMLYIPSASTLQSIKSQKFIKRGISVKQRHPVQIDWISREDGSFMLTVVIGSKILIFSDVGEDMTNLLQAEDKASAAVIASSRPALKKTLSVHQIPLPSSQKYVELSRIQLHTADNLAPLPMSVGWAREGLLVVGMDNEMHCYTQWTDCSVDSNNGKLISIMQSKPKVNNHCDPACALLYDETKSSGNLQFITPEPYTIGLMEVSEAASSILPLYHPRQLNELLNSGKIRRVKAILAHLLKYLTQLAQQSTEGSSSLSTALADDKRLGSVGRSRTISMNAPVKDGRGSLSLQPDELNFSLLEVKVVPPLPLWMLLKADKETLQPNLQDDKENTYAELFGSSVTVIEDDEILTLDDDEADRPQRKTSFSMDNKGITYFGPRQAQFLATMLTHTQLPGLSSLDQMHLLAVADTVASSNVDFADKFDINKAKEALAKETYARNATDEPSMDALDDCGLRFLLAQRHHTYLLRCLPLGQRSGVQRIGVGSHNLAWAFHSESQEELLQFIPSVRQCTPKWSELRELGVGWWIRNNTVLSKLMLMVAKNAFQMKKDPLDAAIYYLAMKKKSLVWGLFRSINDKRMTEFFSSDFSQERWRKAALKNAFALMGKQRFEHAAAFFLLAGALKDAIEVVVSQLHDEQLAMVIIRLYEGELEASPPMLKKMLYSSVLGRDEEGQNEDISKLHPDPFLRSMSYWLMKEYSSSLQTLLCTDSLLATQHPKYVAPKSGKKPSVTTADPTVFNFYIYLRTHPLLIRLCIADAAKDSGGLMASRLTSGGAESLDKKSAYESSMTPLERCLYFTTAYAHLQAGCPMLALEVLSKLPDNVLPEKEQSDSKAQTPKMEQRPALELIHSGTLDGGAQTSSVFDWGAPSTGFGASGGGDELDLDFTIEDSDEEEASPPSEPPPRLSKKSEGGESVTSTRSVSSKKQMDVMAQQLKFISCLKIMMSELACLGSDANSSGLQPTSGFKASSASINAVPASTATSKTKGSGGHLRRELHIWLEKQVHALQEMCGYMPDVKLPPGDLLTGSSFTSEEAGIVFPSSPVGDGAESLHDILQREKLQFEDKLIRTARRKKWLAGNQKLMHTLLGYCSLHGCSGGGLTLVRFELMLLLQELQQEGAGRNMLLSPLPCPTTLPLLSAVVANNKTVVGDPVKHLQFLGHDILSAVAELKGVGVHGTGTPLYLGKASALRDLAIALSSSINQALSDSEGIYQRSDKCESEDQLTVSTQPSKWPGVTSLICLMSREKDEDSPKLSLLLCEALVGVYLCLLSYGLIRCEPSILYRLVSQSFTDAHWSQLFGGGTRKLVKTIASLPNQVLQSQSSVSSEAGSVPAGYMSSIQGATGEQFLSTLSSLQKTRFKFNMKLLGQLGPQEARAQSSDGENKSPYREQFLSPKTNIVTLLMTKPTLPSEDEGVDYDSSESDVEEYLEDFEDEEDIFKEPKVLEDNKEHSDHTSYSWRLLRLAIVKKAQLIIKTFLEVPQLDIQELAVQSPLLHSVMCTLDSWVVELTSELEALQGPPPEYIPGCFAQNISSSGLPISKYRALLELHNTPFARFEKGVASTVRLWQYLVRQEGIQEIFVRYIFARKRPAPEINVITYAPSDDALSDSGDGGGGGDDASEVGGLSGGVQHSHGHRETPTPSEGTLPALEPVRIIHKEQDSVAAFCINKVNSGLISVATAKEVQELDISVLLQHPSWLNNSTELDLLAANKDEESLSASNYLVVQCPADKELLDKSKGFGSEAGIGSSTSSLNFSGRENSGRGANVIRSHKTEGARRMTAHPMLPIYLVGCQDGSVTVREWQHTGVVARPRPGGTFAKVSKLRFNQQGNKFGVIDGDGNLSLYHLGLGTQVNKPFYSQQVHSKHGSDFAFVGSSSLLASCGLSSDHKNVGLWDTLLPPRKSCVVSWLCHENGAGAVLYAPQHQVLLSAGKKGTVCIFDVRQRSLRHRFTAHENAIKCMTMDTSEEFFVTGATDGDIKVWGLSVHNLIYNLSGEHSRTSLFKNLSQGVTQLHMDSSNRLFSCGADGSIKLRTFPERDLNLNLL